MADDDGRVTDGDALRDRDFRFTLSVVLSAALARAERDATPAGEVFSFRLLAAAGHAEAQFPEGGWRDSRHMFSIRVEPGDGRLRVIIQAEGYAALRAVAGRQARLLSGDARIDQRFGFDARGRGLVVLADSAALRTALASVSVHLG